MSHEGSLDQCICLLLHLIWTHMQVGVREGDDAIHNNPKEQHSLHMNTQQTLFIHILFVFMCHSHLYFSFNTLLMPQWIKIQSLLEINNTQNIQRILECFTVRVLKTSSDSTWRNVPTAAASQMTQRGPRPRSNHIHKCFLVSVISTLTLSHLVWRPRQGKGAL